MIKLTFVPKKLRRAGHKVGDVVHLSVPQESSFINRCWGYGVDDQGATAEEIQKASAEFSVVTADALNKAIKSFPTDE